MSEPKTARFALLALPITHKHLAQAREIVVDYELGIIYAMNEERTELIKLTSSLSEGHVGDFNNPHKIKKSTLGLDNVINIEQASKEDFEHHISEDNPHSISKDDVGLNNVANYNIATIEDVLNGAEDKYVTAAVMKKFLQEYMTFKYSLQINTIPEDAVVEVYINNEWSQGNLFNLDNGTYNYRISKDGYSSIEDSITINGSNITLDKEIFAKSETIFYNSFVGKDFVVFVNTDGTLWSWGNNNKGQLGLGDLINRTKPVQVGVETTWSQAACGSNHTIAIKSDGTLWSWGSNEYGQLGHNDEVSKNEPIQVGADMDWVEVFAGDNYSIAKKSDNTYYSFGRNEFGMLGI